MAGRLETAAAYCDEHGLAQPTEAFARRAAELSGRRYVSRQVRRIEGAPRLASSGERLTALAARDGVVQASMRLSSVGGPVSGLEIVFAGPAFVERRIGAPAWTIQRRIRGRDDWRSHTTDRAGDTFRARIRARVPAAVNHRAEAERSSQLAEAVAETELEIHFSAPALVPGRTTFGVSVHPAGYPDAGVEHQVDVNVSSRRGPRLAREKPAETTAQEPWASRCEAILARFERAREDADLRMDLERAVAGLDSDAQRYIEVVLGHGALSDAAAAKALGISTSRLCRAAAACQQLLSR